MGLTVVVPLVATWPPAPLFAQPPTQRLALVVLHVRVELCPAVIEVGLALSEIVGVGTTAVTVTNVAPTVNGGANQTANTGQTVTLTASYTDPGVPDTHTATINWGDGVTTNATVNQAADTAGGTHAYGAGGTFTVNVCVTDDNAGTGCDTMTVTVAAPPALPVLAVLEIGRASGRERVCAIV